MQQPSERHCAHLLCDKPFSAQPSCGQSQHPGTFQLSGCPQHRCVPARRRTYCASVTPRFFLSWRILGVLILLMFLIPEGTYWFSRGRDTPREDGTKKQPSSSCLIHPRNTDSSSKGRRIPLHSLFLFSRIFINTVPSSVSTVSLGWWPKSPVSDGKSQPCLVASRAHQPQMKASASPYHARGRRPHAHCCFVLPLEDIW